MKQKELEQAISAAFSKNDRDAYIQLSDTLNQEMREIKAQKEVLEGKNAKIPKFVFEMFDWIKTIATVCTSVCYGYILACFIFDREDSFITAIQPIIGFVVTITITTVLLTCIHDLMPLSKRKGKIKKLQNRYDRFFIVDGFIRNQIDLLMYQDLYEGVYSVINYMQEKDEKGFEAFTKAAEALNLDYSKYVKKEN